MFLFYINRSFGHFLPVGDGGGEARFGGCLGYRAAQGERRGLVGVEVCKRGGKVAFQQMGSWIVVRVGQRGGELLRISCYAKQPHGGRPLARVSTAGNLRETQLHLRGRAVRVGGCLPRQRVCLLWTRYGRRHHLWVR